MTQYHNLSGKSGVIAYENGQDYIRVQFNSGKIYRYSYAIAGAQNIEHMKILAIKGAGLNSFIMRHVKDLFDR